MPVILGKLASKFVQSDISNHALPLTDCGHPLVDGFVTIVIKHVDSRWVCRLELRFVFRSLGFKRLHSIDDRFDRELGCDSTGVLPFEIPLVSFVCCWTA